MIANGDGQSVEDAKAMLSVSGADGVMIGRGSYGRPWWPGVIAQGLEQGAGLAEPSLAVERDILAKQQEETLSLYGEILGNRTFRKHLGWTITRLFERGYLDHEKTLSLRKCLLSEKDNILVAAAISKLYALCMDNAA